MKEESRNRKGREEMKGEIDGKRREGNRWRQDER